MTAPMELLSSDDAAILEAELAAEEAALLELKLVHSVERDYREFTQAGREADAARLRQYERAESIGESLMMLKDSLRHGEWMDWVREHLPFSHSTCTDFMFFARHWVEVEAEMNSQRVANSGLPPYREMLARLHADEPGEHPDGGSPVTRTVPIGQVTEPPWQSLTKELEPEQVARFDEDLKRHGQLYPLLVRRTDDGKYQIVDGRRRFAALGRVGTGKVKVKVIDLGPLSDQEARQRAFSVNTWRHDFKKGATETTLNALCVGKDPAEVAATLPFGEQYVRNCAERPEPPVYDRRADGGNGGDDHGDGDDHDRGDDPAPPDAELIEVVPLPDGGDDSDSDETAALDEVVREPCPACGGTGYLSVEEAS